MVPPWTTMYSSPGSSHPGGPRTRDPAPLCAAAWGLRSPAFPISALSYSCFTKSGTQSEALLEINMSRIRLPSCAWLDLQAAETESGVQKGQESGPRTRG